MFSKKIFFADPDPWEAFITGTQIVLQWSQVLLNLIILDSVVGPNPDPFKILADPDPKIVENSQKTLISTVV